MQGGNNDIQVLSSSEDEADLPPQRDATSVRATPRVNIRCEHASGSDADSAAGQSLIGPSSSSSESEQSWCMLTTASDEAYASMADSAARTRLNIAASAQDCVNVTDYKSNELHFGEATNNSVVGPDNEVADKAEDWDLSSVKSSEDHGTRTLDLSDERDWSAYGIVAPLVIGAPVEVFETGDILRSNHAEVTDSCKIQAIGGECKKLNQICDAEHYSETISQGASMLA